MIDGGQTPEQEPEPIEAPVPFVQFHFDSRHRIEVSVRMQHESTVVTYVHRDEGFCDDERARALRLAAVRECAARLESLL